MKYTLMAAIGAFGLIAFSASAHAGVMGKDGTRHTTWFNGTPTIVDTVAGKSTPVKVKAGGTGWRACKDIGADTKKKIADCITFAAKVVADKKGVDTKVARAALDHLKPGDVLFLPASELLVTKQALALMRASTYKTIQSLRTDLRKATGELANNDVLIDKQKGQLETARKGIAELTDIGKLERAMHKAILGAVSDERDALRKMNADLRGHVGALTTQVTALTGQVMALAGKVADLTKAVNAIPKIKKADFLQKGDVKDAIKAHFDDQVKIRQAHSGSPLDIFISSASAQTMGQMPYMNVSGVEISHGAFWVALLGFLALMVMLTVHLYYRKFMKVIAENQNKPVVATPAPTS